MDRTNRRQLLRLVGVTSLGALAGCTQIGNGNDQEPTRRAPDWCIDEYDVEVPESERTAESIDGIQRDLDDLTAREDAAYQCHPQGFQLCANCQYFIPSTTREPIGACAIVEGRVRSQDWCALYEPTDRLPERPHANPRDEPGNQVPNPRER